MHTKLIVRLPLYCVAVVLSTYDAVYII